MRQAAVEGVFDFRGFDVLDPRHWRRLHVFLDGLVAKNERQYGRDVLPYFVGRLVVSAASEDGAQREVERIVDVLEDIKRSLWPWAESTRKRERYRTTKALLEAWERVYGRMDDPETQRRIQATVEHLRQMRQGKRQERQQRQKARETLLRQMLKRGKRS